MLAKLAVASFQVVVMVPGLPLAMPELDEPDPALEQPPGGQKLPSVHARAVHLPDVRRFVADVERLGRFRLHPVGQLERLDAGLELGLVAVPLEVLAVELGQQVELGPLRPGADAVVADVRDQLLDVGVPAVQVGSLVDPGRNAACQFCDSAMGKPSGHMTRKPGRFWFSVPRP